MDSKFFDRRGVMISGVAVAAAGLAGAAWGQGEAELVEMKESKYNSIFIHRYPDGTLGMIFGVNRQRFLESLYDPSDPKSLPVVYTRYMTVALAYPATMTSALEIGLGGGRTASYLNRHMGANLDITCVELDPEVIAMAKKYFGVVETPNLRIVAKDGRLYLRENAKKYDLIMIDAYRGTFVPFHLLTKEFFTLVKQRLNPGGAVAQNISPGPMLYDSAIATLKSVFDQVDTFQADGNVVAIAYDGPVRPTSALTARTTALQSQYNFRHPLVEFLGERKNVTRATAKVLTDDFAPVEALRATEKHNLKRTK